MPTASQALAAYKDFLAFCKDGDPDIPILKQAKAECQTASSRLRSGATGLINAGLLPNPKLEIPRFHFSDYRVYRDLGGSLTPSRAVTDPSTRVTNVIFESSRSPIYAVTSQQSGVEKIKKLAWKPVRLASWIQSRS